MGTTDLSIYLERLEKTASRIEITKILAELFGKLDKDEIDRAVYMMLGSLAPSYQNVVFNVAEAMMQRAIARAYNKDLDEVKTLYKKLGDLGIVAESLATDSGKEMSIRELYGSIKDVALSDGEGSQEAKIEKLSNIFSSIDSLSARFVARIPIGKLRLGFSDRTVLDALSWMETGDKSKTKELVHAYEVVPDVGKLAAKVKASGIHETKNITPIIGIPVMPMLAARLKSPTEMIKKMGTVAVEPKFDGLRVQIHYVKGQKVRAFTRNLNDIGDMFPELSDIRKYINADSAILDSEAVGLNPDTKKFLDFQTTMQRRRKYEIAAKALTIPITFQVFDVLYKDGQSLMQEPYNKRRDALEKMLKANAIFFIDEYIKTEDAQVIKNKHEELVSMGLEGVMVKKFDSAYVPGRTGWRWVKMKESEKSEGKLADTVDAVVMGATNGRGKRASFGIGQFLVGILNGNRIQTITKVGTGLTDEQFKELNRRLRNLEVSKKPKEYDVHNDLKPDFWVLPEVVVELAADELTKSPKHTAGLALRFPRLVKFRDDKSVKQATTLAEVKKLYDLQGK